MQFQKFAKAILITLGVISLGACTHTGKKNMDSTTAMNANSNAQAAGAGENTTYGNEKTTKQAKNTNVYYFDFDKSQIRPSYLPALYAQANYLMSNPKAKILLEGHTDPRGSREYNVGLGERRANAIAELLKSKGVNPSQIRLLSYGAEQLAVVGNTEQDYQLDRRAVIVRLQG